jgi:Calcineurin-like phosphoesterase
VPRRTAFALVVTMIFTALVALGSAVPASAATTTLTPVADSYVQADQPAANFGTATTLRVDGSPLTHSYLKFDVQGLTAAPTSATVRVFIPANSSTSINLSRVADTTWTETGLTYANRPAPTTPTYPSATPIVANTFVTYDVTALITGNGLYSFMLDTASTASKSPPSRENPTAANRPQLVLETAAAPTTTPAPQPGPVLAPVADSYVQADQPSANFGTATTLRVDGSPVTHSYLKFDVQGLAAPPTRATLRVFIPANSSTSINASRVADTSWTETGLTFDNRPVSSAPTIPSATPIVANTFVTYDVTAQITGNGLYSWVLDTASTASKSPPSRENPTTANRPQLVLEPAGTTTTTTVPTTTPTTTTPTTTTTTPPPPADPVVAVAGDAACGTTEADYNGGLGTAAKCHMKQTSDIILAMAPQAVFALGDLQYNSGSLADFNVSYHNSWGRFRDITRPVIGNHEYGTSGASGYFTYFGDAATPRQPGCRSNCEGYYSFDIGSWHVAVISSECTRIGGGTGCAATSPQATWLDADLAAHPAQCTAVLTHRPRWASSSFFTADIAPLVDVMHARGVDLLLAGHGHAYERFAPQNPAGQLDDATGIREIVVGTGGRDSQGFSAPVPNSLVRKNQIFGVMKLTLHPTSYDWAYVPDPATPFADAGSGTCH